MRYLMLACRDPAIELTPEDRAAMRDSVIAWVEEMESRGILLPGGHELRPASYGRTVRVRGGEALISDGPFAETKEQIGGFDVLECAWTRPSRWRASTPWRGSARSTCARSGRSGAASYCGQCG